MPKLAVERGDGGEGEGQGGDREREGTWVSTYGEERAIYENKLPAQ